MTFFLRCLNFRSWTNRFVYVSEFRCTDSKTMLYFDRIKNIFKTYFFVVTFTKMIKRKEVMIIQAKILFSSTSGLFRKKILI